jgi:beta-galactosidase/beta-glucuronidase
MHHPRPQLRRAAWRDLSGPWQLAFDDGRVGLDEGWATEEGPFDREIQVPFPFESPASGIGDTGFHPVVWYRREAEAFVAPGRRLLLHLGAVDYRAQVWVNGRLVVTHEGGHTPFSADVTTALDPSGRQVIVVRAEDEPTDLHQPRGKQDWQPEQHAIWYDRTTGIWQPVWLEDVPAVRLDRLRWTPSDDLSAVELRAVTSAACDAGTRLRVVLRHGDRVLVDDTSVVHGRDVTRRLVIDDGAGASDLRWSPATPTLLDATLTLQDADGVVLDEVESYTALRSIQASNGRVLLNGKPYFLRLVLAQNYWPESHLAAPSADALRREVQLAKDLGFNGVRVHQKAEDPRFLAWCDRLGLLVWGEMPAAYRFSTTTAQRLTREWLAVLERDASHPCIVAWVPFNESWGVPDIEASPQQEHLVRALYHLTKAVDPTRLCVGNDGWEHPVTDLLTIHDYAARGAVLRERYGSLEALEYTVARVQPGFRRIVLSGAARGDAPAVLSELGGTSLDLLDRPGWRGYGFVRTPEDLLAAFEDLVGAVIDSPALHGFCWTQLTDTGLERNGLLTADRQPKVDPARIRVVTTRGSAAVPGERVSEDAYDD